MTAAGALIVFTLGAGTSFVMTSTGIRRAVPYRTASMRHAKRGPLELVVARIRSRRRSVHRAGMVKNPGTAAVDGLVAAVSVFDQDGELIGSGDAAVEAPETRARRRNAVCRHCGWSRRREPLSFELPRRRRHRAASRSPATRCARRVVMKSLTTFLRPALAATALVLAVAAVRAQNAEPPSDSGVRFKSGVELINVTATVSDASGRFVPGLRQEDFVVYEDDQPVEVTHFSAERVPVSLGIALDTSGSMAGEKIQEAARRALDRFLYDLLDRAGRNVPLPLQQRPGAAAGVDDGSPAARRARSAASTPNGGTAMYDAVAEAIPLAQHGQNRKKALLVISDGNDTSSATRHPRRASSRFARARCWSTRSASTASGEPTDAPRAVSRRRAAPIPMPFPVPAAPARRRPLAAAAADRRRPGGGWSPRDLQRRSRQRRRAARHDRRQRRPHRDRPRRARSRIRRPPSIADELSKQYYLGYPSTGKKDGRWHAIRVEVQQPRVSRPRATRIRRELTIPAS